MIQTIENIAYSNGIDLIGFAQAVEFKDYLLESSKRKEPKFWLHDAHSIIIVGIYIGGITLPIWNNPHTGRTSRLFLSGFFNSIVKQLEPIAKFLEGKGYKAIICDDRENGQSVLPLKLSALRAGLGWQGKNSLLINKKYGSFLALGGILTNAILNNNPIEEPNRCRGCRNCQKACPVNALNEDFVLDKNKCLSYLKQIQNFPEEYTYLIGNRIIDCEICQEVCPWNHKHIKQPLDTELTKSFKNEAAEWESFFSFSHLINLTKEEYETKLGPLNSEIPFEIFRRNILMAIENLNNSDQSGNSIK